MSRLLYYIVFALVCVFTSCATTPKLHESVMHEGVEPITELEKLSIGGVDQWVLIRGSNPQNPVLLFLHGGPGAGELPLLRYYNYELEKYFTVVTWDQRGAGKSNRKNIPEESINLDQILSDTYELVQYLKKRFHQPKIFLAGHSLGTVLGVKSINAHPEDFYAYVGIGQVVDMKRNIESSYQLCSELVDVVGKKRDIRTFSGMQVNGKYSGGTNLEKAVFMRDWIAKNGRIYYDRNNINNLVSVVLRSPEYSLRDKMKYMNGINRSRKLLWTPELFDVNFFSEAPVLKVPVYFVSGLYDFITSHELTAEYVDFVQAPVKQLVKFEYSAHCGIFEEPEKFNDMMINKVLANIKTANKNHYIVKSPPEN